MNKLVLLLLSLLTLGACKKSEPEVDAKTALLTGKRWRLTAFTVETISNGFGNVSDTYATSPTCQRDDFTTFNRDKTVVFDEGPTKCISSNSQTNTSQWEWFDNQATLAYISASGFSGTVKCDVLELTATTLRLRYTNQPNSNSLLRQEWTYAPF